MNENILVPPDIPDQGVIIEEEILIGGPLSLYCPVFSTPIPEVASSFLPIGRIMS